MSNDERHYFEVGSEDMPSRARPPESDATAAKMTPRTDAAPVSRDTDKSMPGESSAYDAGRAFVAVDYRGDRAESEWLSVGERVPSLLWRILLLLAIIGVFVGLLATCGHVVLYVNR